MEHNIIMEKNDYLRQQQATVQSVMKSERERVGAKRMPGTNRDYLRSFLSFAITLNVHCE